MTSHEKRVKPVAFLIVLFAIPNILFFIVYLLSQYFGSKEYGDHPLIIKKEAVLVVLNIQEMQKLKSITIDSFESEIRKTLKNSKAGELEKKTCDEKECTFAVMGLEADRLQQVIKPVLKTLPVNSGYLKMIYDLSKSNEQIKKDLY